MPERVNVLLVADNARGMRLRTVVLEELGFRVAAVHCGAQGLQLFYGNTFQLVVTDCKLPDGVELIRSIRQHNPSVPIIFISGFAEALGLSGANTGADLVIQKDCYEETALARAADQLLASRAPKGTISLQNSCHSPKPDPSVSAEIKQQHFRRFCSS